MHAKTNRLPEKKEQQNEDQDGEKNATKDDKTEWHCIECTSEYSVQY